MLMLMLMLIVMQWMRTINRTHWQLTTTRWKILSGPTRIRTPPKKASFEAYPCASYHRPRLMMRLGRGATRQKRAEVRRSGMARRTPPPRPPRPLSQQQGSCPWPRVTWQTRFRRWPRRHLDLPSTRYPEPSGSARTGSGSGPGSRECTMMTQPPPQIGLPSERLGWGVPPRRRPTLIPTQYSEAKAMLLHRPDGTRQVQRKAASSRRRSSKWRSKTTTATYRSDGRCWGRGLSDVGAAFRGERARAKLCNGRSLGRPASRCGVAWHVAERFGVWVDIVIDLLVICLYVRLDVGCDACQKLPPATHALGEMVWIPPGGAASRLRATTHVHRAHLRAKKYEGLMGPVRA